MSALPENAPAGAAEGADPDEGAVVAAAAGADAAAGGGRAAGAGLAAPSAASRTRITLPSLTLSPTLARSSFTVPALGAGTSIVALSDSSVTSGSSGLTASPALTSTSMIGTSLKSPMSGTLTSTRLTEPIL